MAKVNINSKGVIVNNAGAGVVIEQSAGNNGFAPYGQRVVTAELVSSTTIVDAGVFTVSGTTASLTQSLSAASGSLGKFVAFRSLSAHLHCVSASGDTGTAICSSTAHGSKVTLPAVVGSSVTLFCDGLNWQVIGSSGSLTYAL